ncbi:hypothetical protein HDU91_000164, partial [Kappamyces sp. JEL0680]
MSVAQYGKKFPILLRLRNPRGEVELLETIGKGNYGYVYKVCILPSHGKGKLLKRESELTAVKVVFLKEDEIKETLLEMEILQACSHPNITAFYDCFLKGLDLWICMEFCGAGSVDSIYRSTVDHAYGVALKKSVSENVIASILYESLLALEYLHTKVALIHRDIKSGNLLLTVDGKVKLADFGVSAQLEDFGGKANTFIGTPYWMAPEVIACDPDSDTASRAYYTDKSDIWSIGITAIEIAEKNPPLSDIHPMQALKLIAKSDIGFAKPKNFSKPFVDFVMSCLVKDPQRRPSATEILQHPFMVQAAQLDRGAILSSIVAIVQRIKEKKKAGLDVTEADEEEIAAGHSSLSSKSSQQTPALSATLKSAKNVFNIGQPTAPKSPSQDHAPPALLAAPITLSSNDATLQHSVVSFAEFPAIVNHVSEGSSQIFEPIGLTSIASELCTADFLDGQYILIGTERGLFYLDITRPTQKVPIPIIHDVRFAQIQILHEYNALVALSGKHSHIRQYSLSSIRKLILYVEGHPVNSVANSNTKVPMQQVQIGQKARDDYEYLRGNLLKDETALVTEWTNDYIKIPETRDSKHFLVEITEATAFLAITFFQGITLFRWAVSPYNKFMKVKSFWVPETPQFVSFVQDGLTAVDLFIGYTSELNRVSISDSKVTELVVHKEMKSKGMTKPRWQSIRQIPYSDAKLEQLLRESSKALGGPTLARLSVTMSERYFLGTYHRLTKVVDAKAHPMVGAGVGGWKDGVMWSEPPVLQILRPLQHVMSCGKNNIEIVEWKTASLKQRLSLDPGSSFKVLAQRHGYTLV